MVKSFKKQIEKYISNIFKTYNNFNAEQLEINLNLSVDQMISNYKKYKIFITFNDFKMLISNAKIKEHIDNDKDANDNYILCNISSDSNSENSMDEIFTTVNDSL
jgi:hypothetical protein